MGVSDQNGLKWKDGELCKLGALYSISNRKILYLTFMCTCPPNLTYSALTICKIITFKVEEKVFSPMPEGYNRVSEAPKPFFEGDMECYSPYSCSRYDMLGTCPQNLISRWGMEHCEKIHFPQGDMLKFTHKGWFLTPKKAYEKSTSTSPHMYCSPEIEFSWTHSHVDQSLKTWWSNVSHKCNPAKIQFRNPCVRESKTCPSSTAQYYWGS
jgi:hypothetical protein